MSCKYEYYYHDHSHHDDYHRALHMGQVDLWFVLNHLNMHAEWNFFPQVLHLSRGKVWSVVWIML